jgi:hypothetical protein
MTKPDILDDTKTPVNGYLGNGNVKKNGVQEAWTEEKIKEYNKCRLDPKYFAKNYCQVIHLDHGLVPFNLYPYQEEMFENFTNERFNIVLACRQSGKSIGCCAYLLWYALFHSEKTVAILANKGMNAREMLERITLMLENLPFFLQPGCKALNKGNIDFSNNSTMVARATSGSSIRSMSVNLLYLDEFAFVEKADTFYTSTYPVITSGKTTKVIITSTANGIGNTFHKLWEGSVQGTNSYASTRVDWWDVPGRDEVWKNETIANTSQLQFDQEYGNQFFGTGNTLINAETLMSFRTAPPLRYMDHGLFLVYSEPCAEHEYIMTVDVSKGRGQDYSTFNIIDISTRPFKQVAVYRNNTISPILFPNVIYKYATVYNEAYVVIENNDQGTVVCNGLYLDLEYENVHVTSAIKSDAIGIDMNRKTKRLGCSAIKDILEERQLEIYDEETIKEISTFEAKRQSYEASDGNHDDLMMNLVMFGYFASTQFFSDMTDVNLKQILFQEKVRQIEQDIVPFGFIDNGDEYIEELEWERKNREDRENWLISDNYNGF